MKGLLLALIVLLALIRDVRSDLPVHCLTSDVAGIWRFCLDRDRDVQLPRCGSDTPNTNLGNLRLSNYSSWLEANRGGVGECITVQLTTDEAADGTSGREDWKRLVVRDGDRTSGDIGRWTMVYDEGFEVRLDNGRVLFAFSHYAPTSEANCPPPHNGQGEDNHGRTQCYVSHCHRTQIGWHSDASEYGCFVGSKLSSRTPRPPRTTNYVRHIAPSADSTQPDNEGDANTPTTTTTAIDTGVCASRRPIFVRYHHHPPTDDVIPSSSAVRFAGKPGRRLTIGSVLRRSGGVSFLQSRALFASNFPCPLAATSTPPTTETRGGQHELPASFSWEGELGRDDVINQQDCGSCYAIACAYALQSRFRIELSRRGVRDVPVQLSAQSVLSCSPYNQGCDGGYPFLVGKHASEVCLQEEKCLGYAATHTSVACPTSHTPLSDDCRSLWFAKSYSYVGGFYEHSSEDRIKAEVFHRGPVVIAINAPKFLSESIGCVRLAVFDWLCSTGRRVWPRTAATTACVTSTRRDGMDGNTLTMLLWLLAGGRRLQQHTPTAAAATSIGSFATRGALSGVTAVTSKCAAERTSLVLSRRPW